MRVNPRHLQFVQSLEPLCGGGLGTAAVQLHLAMHRAGLDSELFATRDKAFYNDWPGVRQFRRAGPVKIYFAPEMAAAATAAVVESSVIHGHGLYVYPNLLFGRLARRHSRPLVYHVNGFLEPWILSRSRVKKRLVHCLFENANFAYVSLWRALTNREADQIRACIGPKANIVVAPNGLDLAPVRHAQFARASGKKRALFLARLHPKKGLSLLIEAWASLGHVTDDWELVIAGPDENGHEAEVRSWVQAMGLSEKVVFFGVVSGEEKFNLLASADLFVLTSYSEGLPMAPLEAMASGVPVAITHECNLPEVATALSGWCCAAEPNSVEAMMRQALQADDMELRQRGAAGRRLVEASFTWPNTVATLNAACQQLL